MILKAYAKVNLGLKIVDERPDGYHNIETILQTVNFFDEIEISLNERSATLQAGALKGKASKGIEFSSTSPPCGKENLCWKAANLFLTKLNPKSGVKINLRKRIWSGAGLGGGSSCAAQTLLGVNKLFGDPFSYEELFRLALELGSDVPFFLKGGIAFIGGKGDIVTQLLPLKKPLWFVLVYPNFSISTAWAYREVRPQKVKNYLTKEKCNLKILKNAILDNDIEILAQNLCNDFELLVFRVHPELQEIKDKMFKFGARGASMSGSGSCVYGILYKDASDGVGSQYKEEFPNFDVKVVEAVRYC